MHMNKRGEEEGGRGRSLQKDYSVQATIYDIFLRVLNLYVVNLHSEKAEYIAVLSSWRYSGSKRSLK